MTPLYRGVYTLVWIEKVDSQPQPNKAMTINVPSTYVDRTAAGLRKLKQLRLSTQQRKAKSRQIIERQAISFFNTCVNPRFTLEDAKKAIGRALAARRACKTATTAPVRDEYPEPPADYKFRPPPDPPEEWVREREAAKYHSAKPKHEQQDFLSKLFSRQPLTA